MTIQRISCSEFASRFSLRPNQLAWFLGSGASAAAGVPTGYSMIADFKKRLFCQLSGTKQQEVDVNDAVWLQRMELFFDARAVLPPPGDATEYAKAFEAVYPTQEARRLYIERAAQKGTPSFGHRVIASLISTGRVPCVFTTNFDQLLETAVTLTNQLLPPERRGHLTVAALENADRAKLALLELRPFLAKLHGDYQSLALKNTSDELQRQDAKMRDVLLSASVRYGLVVVGYSGRDASVMEALTAACSQGAFPGGIYWISSGVSTVSPLVTDLLKHAASFGIGASFVESQTFDELAADIADQIAFPEELKNHIYASRPAPILSAVPLPTHEQRAFPVLQLSAIPISELPSVARRLTVSRETTTVEVRYLLKEAKVRAIAAVNGREIAAFGADDAILSALRSLGPTTAGTIELRPVEDTWALGLLYDSLTRAVCRGRPLFARMRRAGHLVLVAKGGKEEAKELAEARNTQLSSLEQAYSSPLVGFVPEHNLPFNEGIELRIEHIAGRWWCAFEPLTYVQLPRLPQAESAGTDTTAPAFTRRLDPTADWRRERWAQRYNQVWARIIAGWATMLAGTGIVGATGIGEAEGIDAVFQLSPITAWSRPGNEHAYFHR